MGMKAKNINLVNNAKSLDAYKSPALQNNLEKKVQTKIRYEPIDLSNYFDVSDLNVLADTCKYFFAAVSNSTTMNMNTHKSLYNCEKFPGVWCLFTAAPARHSRCSLPWMKGISLPPPFLTFNVG
ncbi:hypothetical protein MG293_000879 [Ovis ammon polii]|uniref:Uncharacterized protein n=1 Tax=Ovis ammon polii TaxID=230172 RepID=A0AAD4UPC1_OVIAM|nr:hypothetical protein MG293_000879 [Ovis ammon polii]